MNVTVRAMQLGAPEPTRASRALWNIDWDAFLPRTLTEDGVALFASSVERIRSFMSAHYAEIFEDDPERHRFLTEPFDDAKLRYLETADVFEIQYRQRVVGTLIAGPSDWSTYYLRSMAVLRPYQGRQTHAAIMSFLFEKLRDAGVRRVEADTSPANLAVIQVLTRMRFNVTGSFLTERWGAVLRLTKYLEGEAEGTFLNTFCSGIHYQRRPARDRDPQKGGLS